MLSRLKFEIAPLVEEMLDQIPKKFWKSKTTTFFDPAIGGGQFVSAVEARLRKYGHTDKNISGRVSGCETHERSVKYAINKHGLIGDYYACDFLETEWNMKFDVIVGNPPYQGTHPTNTGKMPKSHSIWPKISLAAISLLNKNGIIGFVTPNSWMSPNSKLLTKMKEYNLISVNTNIGHYFSVGSSFTFWILQLANYRKITKINNSHIINLLACPYLIDNDTAMNIHSSVLFNPNTKINLQFDTTSAHSQNIKSRPHLLAKRNSATHLYEIFHTNPQTLWAASMPKNLKIKKVIFTTSGYMKPFYDPGTVGTSEICGFIPVKNATEGKRLVSYLSSKLIQFIVTTGKWSGFVNGDVVKLIPAIDLTRTWTDEELYKHFNLTQEEIDYIEANVKYNKTFERKSQANRGGVHSPRASG
jgi:hypothetical protein